MFNLLRKPGNPNRKPPGEPETPMLRGRHGSCRLLRVGLPDCPLVYSLKNQKKKPEQSNEISEAELAQ